MQILECSEPGSRERAVKAAAAKVEADGLVAFPVESAYLVAGNAFSRAPADAIRRLRGIGDEVPLPVLVAGPRLLEGIASGAPAVARDLAAAFWPGPLTLVVDSSPTVTLWAGGHDGTVQLRAPLSPLALELLHRTGPLVTSLARDADGEPVRGTANCRGLEDHVSVFLDTGPVRPGPVSTVVDCTSHPVRVLREGAVDAAALAEVLGGALSGSSRAEPPAAG